MLSSIAGSLITATSLTFSLTVVALQLASSQASPRVLRLFARDRQSALDRSPHSSEPSPTPSRSRHRRRICRLTSSQPQFVSFACSRATAQSRTATLAAFLGTFAYSLAHVAERRCDRKTTTSPSSYHAFPCTLGFVSTLASVIMLVFFLAHLAAQLRVETMLKEIHAETDATIDLIDGRNATTPATTARSPSHGARHGGRGCERIHHASRPRSARPVRRRAPNRDPGAPPCRRERRDGNTTGTVVAVQGRSDRTRRGPDREDVERTIRQGIPHRIRTNLGARRRLRCAADPRHRPARAVAWRERSDHRGARRSVTSARSPHVSSPCRDCRPGSRDPDGQLCLVTIPRRPADDVDASLTPLRHYGAEHPAVVKRFVQAVSELSLVCASSEVDAALVAQLEALDAQIRGNTTDPASNSAMLTLIAEQRARLEPHKRHRPCDRYIPRQPPAPDRNRWQG